MAVVVLLMMRRGGCCGGHGDHGGHHSHGSGREGSHRTPPAGGTGDTAVDPVCGMTVDKATAIRRTFDGVEYFFCSEACVKEFEGRKTGGAAD
ncbi:MAG: YHS domain-containing protein [Betaproteobacteria bacterium]